jgi:integrase/recombinase XerD
MIGRTEQTCRSYYYDLHQFILWSDERALETPTQFTYELLVHFQTALYSYKKADGSVLSLSVQSRKLCSLKAFFRWLCKTKLIPHNPASEIDLPKVSKSLPRYILSLEEIQTLLALPNIETPYGIRDRAILETLYCTGIRRTELVNLTVSCIDPSRKTLLVIRGKYQKDRVLPLSDRALSWINDYLQKTRPSLAENPQEDTLFLTDYGERFGKNRLTDMVKKYLYHANIIKPGACHLFRHAMATHMLDNGADIRYIQEMLGHSQLSTTQIYTQVSIEQLRNVHNRTHPGAITSQTNPPESPLH